VSQRRPDSVAAKTKFKLPNSHFNGDIGYQEKAKKYPGMVSAGKDFKIRTSYLLLI